MRNPFGDEPASGTYNNWTGAESPTLTIDALTETARKLAALPKVENDITVAPNIAETVQALAVEYAHPIFGGVRVWVDEDLMPGTWHTGKPLREQCREALAKPLPIFPEPLQFRPYFGR